MSRGLAHALLGAILCLFATGCPPPPVQEAPESPDQASENPSSGASPTDQGESSSAERESADEAVEASESPAESAKEGRQDRGTASDRQGAPNASGATAETDKPGNLGPSQTAGGNGTGGKPPGGPSSSAASDHGPPPSLKPPAFKSPQAALEYATDQRSKAKEYADSGEKAEAYEDALEGWSALQPHLSDGECRKLSDQLMAEIERYGEQLGSKGSPIIGKRLKIK